MVLAQASEYNIEKIKKAICINIFVMDNLYNTLFESYQKMIIDLQKKSNNVINEMPAWNDAHKVISKDIGMSLKKLGLVRKEMQFIATDKFSVGNLKAIIWNRRSSENSTIIVDVVDDVKQIGEFIWYKEDGKWMTESAGVMEEYQGKGISFNVYVHMIENHMKALYSDTSLTGEEGKGSFDLWVKLGRHFPYRYIYSINDDMIEEVNEFNRDMMNDDNTRFVVADEEQIEET